MSNEAKSWVDKKDEYQAIARKIEPSVRIVTKDAWIWRVAGWILTVVTFGKMKSKTFLSKYATTLGPWLAFPREWTVLDDKILVHEAQHARQQRYFGLWIHPIVGIPLFGLTYIVLLLPTGLSIFRVLFEINADMRAVRFALDNGSNEAWARFRAKEFGETVSSAHYYWPLWLVSGPVRFFESLAGWKKHKGFKNAWKQTSPLVVRMFSRAVEKVIREYSNK